MSEEIKQVCEVCHGVLFTDMEWITCKFNNKKTIFKIKFCMCSLLLKKL